MGNSNTHTGTQTDPTVDERDLSTCGTSTSMTSVTSLGQNTKNQVEYRFKRLNNFATGNQLVDTLYRKSIGVGTHTLKIHFFFIAV